METSSATAFLTCPLCNTRSPSIHLWMSHLRQVHSSELNVSISCPVDECSLVYSKVNSLCSHIYRHHKSKDLHTHSSSVLLDSSTSSTTITQYPDGEHSLGSLTESNLLLVSHEVNQLLHRDMHEQMKKSCLFLMQLKEERLLTQAAVNDVVSGCKEVFEHTLGHLRAGVSQKISQSGIDFNSITGLDDVFANMSDPFVGLESVYLQDKFISQELGCIVSQ